MNQQSVYYLITAAFVSDWIVPIITARLGITLGADQQTQLVLAVMAGGTAIQHAAQALWLRWFPQAPPPVPVTPQVVNDIIVHTLAKLKIKPNETVKESTP